MACLDQYLKDKTHQQLHYNAAKNIPKELLFKWFSVCPKDTIMDNTTKYIWGNRCCARCTQDYVPPAMTNRKVDVRVKKFNNYIELFVKKKEKYMVEMI